jgi:hypothetical protein
MDPGPHPDPLHEAMSHGLQRAVQVASSAATALQVYAYLGRAHTRTAAQQRERVNRALNSRQRAERDIHRAAWAPALDPRWLRHADLLQTARVWAAAMPYADPKVAWHEPAAKTAMDNCEGRLRDLHPTAMGYYDRLRGDGMGPGEAMRDAAFLFAGPPRAHPSPYTPRPALEPGSGENLARVQSSPDPPSADSASLTAADTQERRGRQIADALQARARDQGHEPLGETELHLVLETVTNLPADVIDRVAQGGATPHAARRSRVGDVPAGQATAEAQAAQPWKHDFPVPIDEVVASAATAARRTASPAVTAAARAKPSVRHTGPRP